MSDYGRPLHEVARNYDPSKLPETCPHDDYLEPAWCSRCVRLASKRPPGNVLDSQPDAGTVLVARYDGQCRGCNLPISVGQRIRRYGEFGYRHDGC